MLKYFFFFGSKQLDPANARHWKIEIFDTKYVGAPIEVSATGDPVSIVHASKSIYDPIRGSMMTLNLKALVDFQFEEFFQTFYGEYTVHLIEDPTGSADIRWAGYNEANIYREPWVQPPYTAQLKFTDGLGHLKSVEFKDNTADVFYSGQRHILETFRLCLNELGELNLVDIVNIYENNQSDGPTDSMLTQTYTDVSTYRSVKNKQVQAWSCHKVLTEVLRSINATVFQHEGKWVIMRPAEQKEGSLTSREFLPELGNESDTVVNTTASILHTVTSLGIKNLTTAANATLVGGAIDQGTQLERFTYRFTPNHFAYVGGSILPNSFFFKEYGLTDFPLPLFWTEGSNTTPADIQGSYRTLKDLQTKIADENNDGQPDQEIVVRMDATATTSDPNNFMESEVRDIFIESTDHIGLKVEFNLVEGLPGASIDLLFRIRLEADNGDLYYFRENGTWTNANASPYIMNIGTFGVLGTGKVRAPKIGLGDSVPFAGKANLNVVVFRPVKGGGGSFQDDVFVLKNISIDYLIASNGDSLPQKQLIYIEEVASVADRDTFDMTVVHSDGLDQISQNSFRLLNGNITQDWHRVGEVETLKIWELIAKDVLELKTAPYKLLSGTLLSHNTISPLTKLRTNVTAPSGSLVIDFAVVGVKWEVKKDEYMINATEIDTHIYVPSISTIIDESNSPTEPTKGLRGQGGAKYTNQGIGTGGTPTAANQPINFPT